MQATKNQDGRAVEPAKDQLSQQTELLKQLRGRLNWIIRLLILVLVGMFLLAQML